MIIIIIINYLFDPKCKSQIKHFHCESYGRISLRVNKTMSGIKHKINKSNTFYFNQYQIKSADIMAQLKK